MTFPAGAPTPIVALDVSTAAAAMSLVDRLPQADFFKVGLQLFTAEGPEVVRVLKRRGKRIFLDLKFHDIPNTVAGAVRSAADLEVDLLTIHAAGGPAMLDAAAEAAAAAPHRPLLFAVTVLTSLGPADLSTFWARDHVDVATEVTRIAGLAAAHGADGLVASVRELAAIRTAAPDLLSLTPGIRLTGDAAGDQARVATPADATRAGADFLVLGRTITAAPEPAAAFERAVAEIDGALASPR
ncbi:MAG TPA: orotidine-5'-phosphate decarboxylase [Longimicrobiaceae bacterium]|nr:orotidine-5'-phosphate decarboxylase [Longimicrobiaceae bacterium]